MTQSTHKGSFQLFRFAGITVFLHWSWFVVAAYEIRPRGSYPSIAWNIAEYLTLFLIVTSHEFGHALACRQVGGIADEIVLWPLGGVAYVDPPPRPGATLWSIAAGPLVNVVLLGVFYPFTIWAMHQGWKVSAPSTYRFLWAFVIMNLALLVFNLLPIYPLDGGQILRSLLWFMLGRARSLQVASALGLLGAFALVVFAISRHSIWIGLIAAYMVLRCWTGFQQAQVISRSESPAPASRGRLGEEYSEITELNIQSRVRARYSSKVDSVQALGFQHLAFCLELLPPYSAILKFPLVLVMLRREALVFPRPARLGIGSVLLRHSSPNSIAQVLGLGIKFYSVFSDGTLLISSTYRSPLSPGPNSKIIKNPHCPTADEAWLAHRQRAAELVAQGLRTRILSSFADYLEIENMKLSLVIEE